MIFRRIDSQSSRRQVASQGSVVHKSNKIRVIATKTQVDKDSRDALDQRICVLHDSKSIH
jgi:hypothetical protein